MKKENIFSYIEKSRARLLDGILNISSLFFIAFTFLAVMFPSTSSKPMNVLIGWAILLFITSSKFFSINIRLTYIKITNIVGSLLFLFLFISSWLNSQIFLVKIYGVYRDGLQSFLNQFFIMLLLIPIVFYIFIEALKLILSGLGYLFDKINAHQKIRIFVVSVIVITWIIALMIVTSKYSSLNLLKLTPYLIPFFGFSLLYLHLNFLVREIKKFGQSSTVSN